ncbi:MAG: hypothetical protein ACTSV7_08205 [Candidatus Baldrarchaeia archaeon]
MVRKYKLTLFVDDSQESLEAKKILEANKSPKVIVEITHIKAFKSLDFHPPLLFTPEGSYSSLKQIQAYAHRLHTI